MPLASKTAVEWVNQNECRVTGYSCSKFESLNFFLLHSELYSFVPQLCRFLTTSQLVSSGFLFFLPMCICGACMKRQKQQGKLRVWLSTHICLWELLVFFGWGRKCRLLDTALRLCLFKSEGKVGSLHNRDAKLFFFFLETHLVTEVRKRNLQAMCKQIVQNSI